MVCTMFISVTACGKTDKNSEVKNLDIEVPVTINVWYDNKDYETYLTDQFPWRDGWIGLKTSVEKATFKTETNDVYFAIVIFNVNFLEFVQNL